MRICIDARWIFEHMSGIGVHTRELIRALSELDCDNEYRVLYCDEALRRRTEGETGYLDYDNWESRVVPWSVFSPAGQLKMPGWLKREGIDVFHSTNYMIPLWAFSLKRSGPIKCVVTLHDLIPILFRDHAPKSRKARLFPVYMYIMRQVVARAHTIITVSDASARDVREHLQPTGQVVTVYNGISSRYQQNRDVERVDIILYVGRFDPYKNVPLLVEAFADARERIERPVTLQIIGAEDPRYPEALQVAKQRGVNEFIDWTHYVSDEELLNAYQSARVLVLPSDYEGFGMPVLEAMACGTPAICARSSSLPEVAGEAGLFFEPGNREQLTDLLVQVFDQGGPSVAQLTDQASKFTWDRAARHTLEVYRS